MKKIPELELIRIKAVKNDIGQIQDERTARKMAREIQTISGIDSAYFEQLSIYMFLNFQNRVIGYYITTDSFNDELSVKVCKMLLKSCCSGLVYWMSDKNLYDSTKAVIVPPKAEQIMKECSKFKTKLNYMGIVLLDCIIEDYNRNDSYSAAELGRL